MCFAVNRTRLLFSIPPKPDQEQSLLASLVCSQIHQSTSTMLATMAASLLSMLSMSTCYSGEHWLQVTWICRHVPPQCSHLGYGCDVLLMSNSISCACRWLWIYCSSLLLFPEWWLILITLLSWTSSQAPPLLTPTFLIVLLHKWVFSMSFQIWKILGSALGYWHREDIMINKKQSYTSAWLHRHQLFHPHLLSSFIHLSVHCSNCSDNDGVR